MNYNRPPPTPNAYYSHPISAPVNLGLFGRAPSSPPIHPPWIIDSGVSHHITNDLSNISLHFDYIGTEEIHIGNGNTLSISHIGFVSLPSPTTPVSLSHVYCAP